MNTVAQEKTSGFSASSLWSVLVVGTLAHGTMLLLHFSRMWDAEHFQFFPVAIFAAIYLAYLRRFDLVPSTTTAMPEDGEAVELGSFVPQRGSVALTCIGLFLVSVILFFVIVLNYALTGWLCYIFFLAVLVYAAYSWRGLRAMLPAFVVLLVIKPLPGFAEQWLTISMQKLASTLASYLLDLGGIIHYTQGVVLNLAKKSFMAEEACSGIRSLFSSITAIIVWGFMNQYRWTRHLLNILQTIFWVIVFNAIRIAIVVAVEDQTSLSLAEGMAHTALGFVIFFFIFGFVISTDQLFASVVLPLPVEESLAKMAPRRWTEWLDWKLPSGAGYAFAATFFLLFLLSARLMFLIPDYKDKFSAGEMPPPLKEHFPEKLGAWETTGFEHIHRAEQNIQGQDSYVWRLRNGNRYLLFSVDGTFGEFHDLGWCYSALGWTCLSENKYTPIEDLAKGISSPEGEYSSIHLSKLTGETGLIMFTGVDRNGQIVAPIPHLGQETGMYVKQSIINSLRFAVGMQTTEGLRATTFTPPVSNIQMVYYPNESMEKEEEEELRQLFLMAREHLRLSPRFQSKP